MKKSTFFTTILAMLLGIVMGVCATPAFAVDGAPPDLFELDGNPADDSGAGLPDDWETLYVACDEDGKCPGGIPFEFTGIIADPAPVSIFTTGGSKDILDISKWKHKDGSVPDKDDITNAFAAAYVNPDDICMDTDLDPAVPVLCTDPDADTAPVHFANDQIIYFGFDRYDNSGDAFGGFWFLINEVGLDANDPGTFDNIHVAKTATSRGDLLVLVEYPQGSNEVPLIKVYEWDPDLLGDPNVDEDGKSIGPLEMIYNSEDETNTALCDGLGGKLACAITNDFDIEPPPWPYTPKGGDLGDWLPHETFYSGGINLTQLLGGENICVSTFLAETRSSRSETAQLKDFVLGGFSLCGSEITTRIHDADHTEIGFPAFETPDAVLAGTQIHDNATVTITGPGLELDPTGTVDFYLYDGKKCGLDDPENPVAARASSSAALVPGTLLDNIATAESAAYNLPAAQCYSFHAEYTSTLVDFPDATLGGEECEWVCIDKYPSQISTQIHESGGHSPDIQTDTVYVGLTIHDHAYVSVDGTFPGTPPTPGGTVDFKLYETLDCTGGFTAISGRPLDGSGEAVTGDFEPLGDTVLSYKASYSGDGNYEAATDSACEPLTVIKYDSELSTEIHKGTDHGTDYQNGDLAIGDSYHDHAYWNGILDTDFPSALDLNPSLPLPIGDVTFELFRTLDCSGESSTTFGGISWPQSDGLDVIVHPAYDAETLLFNPPSGPLSIKASWVEDANYHGSTAACEKLEIHKVNPTILTKVIVRDRAEVTGGLSVAPTGDVTIKTYRSNDCSGTAVNTVILPLPSSGVVEQSTALEQILEVGNNVASYLATYEGDDNYLARDHKCELVQFSVLP